MDKKFEEILNQINADILANKDCDLLEEGIIDSLTIMTMVVRLESEYDIEIDPDEIAPENFESVDAIWALVEKYVAEKG
ncbi:MAG: acyl carrier protein [Selenomonas sp.]|nr:acyl carrier protein [Selenomonas sp.]